MSVHWSNENPGAISALRNAISYGVVMTVMKVMSMMPRSHKSIHIDQRRSLGSATQRAR